MLVYATEALIFAHRKKHSRSNKGRWWSLNHTLPRRSQMPTTAATSSSSLCCLMGQEGQGGPHSPVRGPPGPATPGARGDLEKGEIHPDVPARKDPQVEASHGNGGQKGLVGCEQGTSVHVPGCAHLSQHCLSCLL